METFTQVSGMTLVELQGHLTQLNAPELKSQISTALAADNIHTVQLNLAQVQFMDSSALAAIATGVATARQLNRKLVLCQVPPTIRLMLEITGLDQLLEVIETP